MGIGGLIYATLKRDISLLLWIIPFSIFLFLVGYGIYFYIIPLLPAFCIGAAILIVGLPSDIAVTIQKDAKRRPLFRRKNKDQALTTYMFDGQSMKDDIISHHVIKDTSNKPSSLISRNLPYIILSVIGGLGLTSSIMLLTTNVSSAQFEATALGAEYIIKNPDDLSVVSGPVYSWIYKYVLGKDNVGNSFLDVDWKDIQNGNVLLVADNHFKSSMLHDNEKELYEAYNDSADIVRVSEKGPGYDINRYPFTNLRASREGDSVELKAGLVPSSEQFETIENSDTSSETSETSENGNNAVTVNDNLLMHTHTRLEILVDGTPITIPANIGIDSSLRHDRSLDRYGAQKSPIVTYTTSGTSM